MSIKVGIIGAGVISEAHVGPLQDISGVEVAAIADSNRETLDRQVEKYNIRKKVTDYRQLLDDKQINLIYVCVPHHLHCGMTIEAFAAGKDVVCEKPLSMNAEEADRMIEAAKKAGRRFFVAENHRFFPEHIKARQMLKAGNIGRSFMCLSCFIGDETERMSDPAHWKGTQDKSGGGVIIDNGFHMIDTLRLFFGEVESVLTAAKRLAIEAENKEEDTALITISFKSGVLVELSLTFAARYNDFPPGYVGAGIRYDIYGTEGSLHLVNDESKTISLITASGRQVYTAGDVLKSLPDGFPTDMNRHFIDCLLNNTEPVLTVQEARQVMRIIDACYESVRTGKKVLI